MLNRIKRSKAFTLIEVIVVFLLIAILAAIAAVSYQSVQDNAKKQATVEAVQQFNKDYVANLALQGDSAAALTSAEGDMVDAGWTVAADSTSGAPTNVVTFADKDGDIKAEYSLPTSTSYQAATDGSKDTTPVTTLALLGATSNEYVIGGQLS